MKTKLFWLVMAFAASVTFSSAQSNAGKGTNQSNRKGCYVDADKNGVCDNHENKACKKGNGKGLCDGSGHKKGNGHCGSEQGNRQANYVDANKNGICDHREKAK